MSNREFNVSEEVEINGTVFTVRMEYKRVDFGVPGSSRMAVGDYRIVHAGEDLSGVLSDSTITYLIDRAVNMYEWRQRE